MQRWKIHREKFQNSKCIRSTMPIQKNHEENSNEKPTETLVIANLFRKAFQVIIKAKSLTSWCRLMMIILNSIHSLKWNTSQGLTYSKKFEKLHVRWPLGYCYKLPANSLMLEHQSPNNIQDIKRKTTSICLSLPSNRCSLYARLRLHITIMSCTVPVHSPFSGTLMVN